MGKEEKTIIVSQTHWDREWYLTFNRFRFRLVAMIDRLLNILEKDKDFTSFMMDGQTSPIEDYLAIRPENEGRLAKFIKEKRIIIGPFYVQNSPWLQTGEGYVKNLLVGHRNAESYGVAPMKVGYIPDQFMHFEQMPQVLRGFGIYAMAFSRGMGNQQEEHGLKFEFTWKAPDGSEVTALHLAAGYGQCTGLPDDPDAAVNMILFGKAGINRLEKSTRWNLLFSGSDHRVPEAILPSAIKLWNTIEEITEDEGTLQHGSLEEYVQNVLAEKPELATYAGELIGHRYQFSAPGVLSSCMWLKRKNFLAHDLLERYAQPLSVISRNIAGARYDSYIQLAWKWLLKNQAHDSSWTASWDQTEKEIETRYDWSIQNADEVKNWAFMNITTRIKVISESNKHQEITIFNPLQFSRKGTIFVTIPRKFDLEDGYTIIDGEGKMLKSTFEKVEITNKEIFLLRKFVGSHGGRPKYYYNLAIEAVEVPPVGYTTLIVNPTKEKAPQGEVTDEDESVGLRSTDNSVENEVIKLEINKNGTFKLTDKVNGAVYDYLNSYKDISDIGDSWLFRPLPGDISITSNACEAEIKKVLDTSFATSFQVDICYDIPAKVNFTTRARSDDNIPLKMTTIVTVHAGDCPRVDIIVKFVNPARDHRLSVAFPTGFEADTYQVDGHFGLTTRQTSLPDGTGWKKPPQEQGPQHKFVTVTSNAGDKGLLIANRGIPECEACIQEDGTVDLGLTLLRSIGRWGVHMGEGSPITVDITQCIGSQEFEYSIIPHQGKIFPRAYKEALQFRYPVYAVYKEAHNKYEGYFPNIEKPEAFLPMSFSFFKLSTPELALSTIKKAERTNDTIVRVFNLSKTEKVSGTLETSLDVKKVALVDLNEEELDDTTVKVDHSIHSIHLEIPPAKIVTLKLSVE